jgi:hypothetical protein
VRVDVLRTLGDDAERLEGVPCVCDDYVIEWCMLLAEAGEAYP